MNENKVFYKVSDNEGVMGLADLQNFALHHPAIAEALRGYVEGFYDYEQMLMMCLEIMIDEYIGIRTVLFGNQSLEEMEPLIGMEIVPG